MGMLSGLSDRNASAGGVWGSRAAVALVIVLASGGLGKGRAWGGGPQSVRIDVQSDASVRGPFVTLGEVAVVRSTDADLRTRVEKVNLGRAPSPGQVVVVDRDRLLRWLVARGAIEKERVELAGAPTLRVRRTTRDLAGQELAAAAQSTVRVELQAAGWRAEVGVLREPPALAVPEGRLELRCRSCSVGPVFKRRPVVWVDVAVDGAVWRTVPVTLELRVWGDAYVAARSVARGTTLARDDVAVREVEVSGLEPLRLGAMEERWLRARREIETGGVLTRAHVEPAPEVSAGGPVTLWAHEGEVEIEGRVVALDEGRVGQVIRVKLVSGTSTFLARVKGPGMVEELQ